MEKVLLFPRFSKALAVLPLVIACWKLITLSPYAIGFSLRYLASPSMLYSFAFDLAVAAGALLLWRGRLVSRWFFAAQAAMTSAGWLATGGLSRLPCILLYLKGINNPDAPAIHASRNTRIAARITSASTCTCTPGNCRSLACSACFKRAIN